MQRIIGSFTGSKHGALVIAFGGVHGNELAGVKALQEVFFLLDQEPKYSPDFNFSGRFVGLVGNLKALHHGSRFMQQDMNRMWTPAGVEHILAKPKSERLEEEVEIAELYECILENILEYRPTALVLLDLHTTSAEGGIFCIPSNTPASLRLAKELHAPVILGLLDGIKGTLLHFAEAGKFRINGMPEHCIGIAFEGGQHHDPLSVSRCIAAVINCLKAAGCIDTRHVDTRHDHILLEYAETLPKVTRLEHVHHIDAGDHFVMKPGYVNFQAIQKGEHLADDVSGAILSPLTGRILMPLYQPQGTDGFFIIRDLEEES